MFRTSDIKVDIPPVAVSLGAYQLFVIMRIHITEVVGRRTGKTWHCVQFKRAALLGVPVLGTPQRGFAGFGRQVFVDFRQMQRKLVLAEHYGYTVLVIYRERFPPVALAAENGITQAVVYLYFAYTFTLDEFLCSSDCILHLHPVKA